MFATQFKLYLNLNFLNKSKTRQLGIIHQKPLNQFWRVDRKVIEIRLVNCVNTKGSRNPICDSDEIKTPDEQLCYSTLLANSAMSVQVCGRASLSNWQSTELPEQMHQNNEQPLQKSCFANLEKIARPIQKNLCVVYSVFSSAYISQRRTHKSYCFRLSDHILNCVSFIFALPSTPHTFPHCLISFQRMNGTSVIKHHKQSHPNKKQKE